MENYDLIIRPKKHAFDIDFKEIWQYRDLLMMFVKRDIITVYKQTILGPIWFVLQPILTTAMFILVFGNIAQISTDGLPMMLFYLSNIVVWNYFSECFNSTAKTFSDNANIFGKVYFPRLIMPLSKIISNLIKFLIQFAFFIIVYAYFLIFKNPSFIPNWTLVFLPIYLILMALLGLGSGIIFTSLTTKYRDLAFLLTFGVQLLMYATPVIYPLSNISEGSKMRFFIELNPLTPIVEGFRYGFFSKGYLTLGSMLYCTIFTIILLFIGIVIFHRTERNFIDTV